MAEALDYITGLGAVAGNLASTIYTNNKNAQLIERQNRLNIEQWQRENQYNLPIMQVERLKQAGLNPNLMFGEGAGSLLSAPSPEMRSSQYQAPQIDPLTMAQIRKLEAETQSITDDNNRQNQLQPLNMRNLSAQVDNLTSQSILAKSSAAMYDALKGKAKQEQQNLLQQWEQNNQSFQYLLSSLESKARIDKETAARIARSLEASISSAEALAKFNGEQARLAGYKAFSERMIASAQQSQAITAANRLNFDTRVFDEYTSKTMQADMELKLSELRKNISETVRNWQESDLFDDTQLAKIIGAYTDLLSVFR